MNTENIPTPETDATDDRQTERSGGAAYLNMRHQSRDLERRLTIAREAMDGLNKLNLCGRAYEEIETALTLTAPKQ